MAVITIIGNGPSRDIYYKHAPESDVVIGCNFPASDMKVDYSSFVDAFAARLLRVKQKHHHRLGEFKLLIGERCMNGLNRVKHVPGGVDTMYEGLEKGGHIEAVVPYPEKFRDEQRFLSSGHLAFLWAAQEFGEGNTYHLFGFDSVFSKDHRASYSNADVRQWDDPYIKRDTVDELMYSGPKWMSNWELLTTEMFPNEEIYAYGYEGDPKPLVDIFKPIYIREESDET